MVESTGRAAYTIEPAQVGVTAIIGFSDIGPVGEAQPCYSESEANRYFGDFADAPVLAAAVHGFFQNGGRRCVIVNLGETPRRLVPADLAPLKADPHIELVCAPGQTDPQDYQVLLDHCAEGRTRLALLDGPRDLLRQIPNLRPPAADHGAYYVPWLMMHDPVRHELVAYPPSGHMAGLMARVAHERGVHKAPANEPLTGLVELAHEIGKAEQDILHPRRINCIRRLPRLEGFRPWGAQTLAPRGPLVSISTFRVYSFIVRSFQTGCPWLSGATSEPELWGGLQRAAETFLTQVSSSGALAGESADQAFRFRCDASLNDFRRRDSGMVFFEMGLALTRPGQFYTFQMGLDISGF